MKTLLESVLQEMENVKAPSDGACGAPLSAM
jgi:hypothetical protein